MVSGFEGGWIEIGGCVVMEGVLCGAEMEMLTPPLSTLHRQPYGPYPYIRGTYFMLSYSCDSLHI